MLSKTRLVSSSTRPLERLSKIRTLIPKTISNMSSWNRNHKPAWMIIKLFVRKANDDDRFVVKVQFDQVQHY